MSNQYILLNHVHVEGANAVSGELVYGFPSVTNFAGFVDRLSRELNSEPDYRNIKLPGPYAVIVHKSEVNTYYDEHGNKMLSQSRGQPYLPSLPYDKKSTPPPIVEEGKINLTISLVIEYEGTIGNQEEFFKLLLRDLCPVRLCGGTITNLSSIDISFFSPEDNNDVRLMIGKLLPGYVLLDCSKYLEEYYQGMVKKDPNAEIYDAWLDFIALRQRARPKSNLISEYISRLAENEPDNLQFTEVSDIWDSHLEKPYYESEVPYEIVDFFDKLIVNNKIDEKLLSQWNNYCHPNDNTDADWEYVKKPYGGYLVPISIGFKAISKVYKNKEVDGVRDNKTNVCFVESVYSVGEWKSINHIKTVEQLQKCLWHSYRKENWYLCRQSIDEESNEYSDDENSDIENIYN